jgi:hypothetical protein
MIDYLFRLEYEPAKVSNADYWHLSRLRNEKVPSFKINRKLNRWFDHGLGKGGNLLDFSILFYNCTVREFLQKIGGEFSFQQPGVQESGIIRSEDHNVDKRINILNDFQLSSFYLLRYLEQRKIPFAIADQFCREVRFELNSKIYYGIGFKNDSGGFEIRSPYFKISSSPKDITTFNNGAKDVAVFEGFFDFLSFMTMGRIEQQFTSDFVILNSLYLFEKARLFTQKHERISLYFDRDKAGQNCSQHALSLSNKYKDESCLYKQYKDLNDWLVNIEKGRKKNLGVKLK